MDRVKELPYSTSESDKIGPRYKNRSTSPISPIIFLGPDTSSWPNFLTWPVLVGFGTWTRQIFRTVHDCEFSSRCFNWIACLAGRNLGREKTVARSLLEVVLIMGFPATLWASRSAPRARIDDLDTFFTRPFDITATVRSVRGYYGVWYKIQENQVRARSFWSVMRVSLILRQEEYTCLDSPIHRRSKVMASRKLGKYLYQKVWNLDAGTTGIFNGPFSFKSWEFWPEFSGDYLIMHTKVLAFCVFCRFFRPLFVAFLLMFQLLYYV